MDAEMNEPLYPSLYQIHTRVRRGEHLPAGRLEVFAGHLEVPAFPRALNVYASRITRLYSAYAADRDQTKEKELTQQLHR